MRLNQKVSMLFLGIAVCLIAVLVGISLFAFRLFSIASATEHIRTAAEIVRVGLTDAMVNGVIDKREGFLQRLIEVQGLKSARVVRSPLVQKQFGQGLAREAPIDEVEREVLRTGVARYEMGEAEGEAVFRGTIPFVATNSGSPHCLNCHQVPEGAVLGAVSMTLSVQALKEKGQLTIAVIAGSVTLFVVVGFVFARRLIGPVSATAVHVERAVQKALQGDFRSHVAPQTSDEIGQIASDMNRLLGFLDDGLNRIGQNVAQLTNHTPGAHENLLAATTDMVDSLTKAAHFKQAIEEDETKAEIYQRLALLLEAQFGLDRFSIYEVNDKNQLAPLIVDGQPGAPCRWCDPQILIRAEGCRARRTGHVMDGLSNPGLCYAFQPPADANGHAPICFPIIQSGSVGSIVQCVVPEAERERVLAAVPYVSVYLREAAPVLEAKRLTETLRESNLRDPMTGLSNRRFLEEYVETLVFQAERRRAHLSILMLDLDYFKMVNDTYGHDAGDTVLKALAKLLKQSVRASDLVIRYGGEEFLIILQDTQAAAADAIAEKIRANVEQMKVQAGGTTLQKTISIGIADFPSDSDTFWQAVKFADVALYRAKEGGRNRVVRFEPPMWTDKQEY